jgi:PAS domain S-box-containing protein
MSGKEPTTRVSLNVIFQAITRVMSNVLVFGPDSRIVLIDDSLGEKLGYSSKVLLTKRILELTDSLSEDEWTKWWKEASVLGQGELDLFFNTPTGQKFPANLKVGFFHLEQSTLAVGQFHLTAEVTLLPLLQECARLNRCAVWEWHLIAGKFRVSDYFYQIFQLHPEEGIANRTNIIRLLQNRLSISQMQQLTTGLSNLRKLSATFEDRLTLNWDGITKTVDFLAMSVRENGQVTRLKGMVKEVVLEGREDDSNQLILDRAKDMIGMFLPNGHFIYANRSLCRGLGYTPEELMNEVSIHQIDIENTQAQWNGFRRTLEGEEHCELKTSFQRKDGTFFPIEATLVRLENGLTGLMANDITAQRQEEQRLKAAMLDIHTLTHQLEAENTYLQEEVYHHFDNIVSNSKSYADVLHQVRQVAPTDTTVLIQGESGTGKELLAHAVHRLSKRNERTLVKVNCAALPKDIIESELFGHEKGAFTGADRRRIGRFELADGGTIFLDEIGELPLDVQVKLLRVIQEGQFERVGSSNTLTVDVRIIAATNKDLQKMTEQRTFRQDLFYRLSVFPIENLPLRHRKEDIPLLIRHFLQIHNKRMVKDIRKVSPEDLKRLEEYPFPGNVRELENIIERAVILTDGQTLDLSFWKPDDLVTNRDLNHNNSGIMTMKDMQRDLINRALEASNWTVSGPTGAAVLLDMHPQTLYSRMRKLGIKLKK